MTPELSESAKARLNQLKTLQDQFLVSPEVIIRDIHVQPYTPYFRTNNFIQNTFARLAGWYPTSEDWRRIIVDAQGRVEVSTIQASYDNSDSKAGNAPDAFGAAIAFDDVAKRVDVFVWNNDAYIKMSPDGAAWNDNIEIPANTIINMDATAHSINIQNKVAGNIARYQFVGWW